MNNDITENEVKKLIIDVIKKRSPKNVEGLIKTLEIENNLKRNDVINIILELENENKIIFKKDMKKEPINFKKYIFSTQSYWFWISEIILLLTIVSIFIIPENYIPLNYLRNLLGSITIVILPGFNLIKIIFPTTEIDNIERIVLIIGGSITLVPLIGLLLNFTELGLGTIPIIISILLLTIILSVIALYREYIKILDKNKYNI